MNYYTAVAMLQMQDRRLKRVNGLRFLKEGFEYRLMYSGGFVPLVKLDRRAVGRRKFQYFATVDVSDCRDDVEAMDEVYKTIDARK